MHTSNALNASDFVVRNIRREGSPEVPFPEFCPAYHRQDRIAIVSSKGADAVCHTAGAVLAITTAFYDALRAASTTFYDYPQHFAIVSGEMDRDSLAEAWGALDIWPDSQWLSAPASLVGTLSAVFTAQINRLFWPENLDLPVGEERLPVHVRRLLASRLKSVHYFHAAEPTHALQLGPGATDIMRKAFRNLPDPTVRDVEPFRIVEPDEFIEDVGHCFVDATV